MPGPIIIATIMRPAGDTGVQTHFQAFAQWMSGRSVPHRMVTPYSAPKWQVYPVFALRTIIAPFSGPFSVWWYRYWHAFFLRRALRKILMMEDSCVVYAQCPLSAEAALQVRRSSSQRVTMVVHFNVSQADEWAGKGEIAVDGRLFRSIRQLEERVLPKLDGLIFVSDFMRREVFLRIPAIRTVPHRVVPNFLSDPGTEPGTIAPRAELICVGTLEPRKNQRYALEIIAAARAIGRPLRLTLVGDGPDRTMLESLAKNLGVDGDVEFRGHVTHAATLMREHLAYLHVARMESFGITLIEAMGAGVPVFAPGVGGIPEVFTDGVEGRLIPLGDAKSAAEIIVGLVDDPAALDKLGQGARQRFVSRFESGLVASILAEFLIEKRH